MKDLFKVLLISALVLSVGVSFAKGPEYSADQSAKDWLALVDAGKYAQSYEEASSLFKTMVDKNEWIKAVGNLRSILGEVQSRKLVSSKRMTKLAGAPDGEYTLLTYGTKFAKKANAREVIIPMRDKDGKWRVSGYRIE